jgi:sugar transferase (PEP-CTERM/EpsH1 system associated)
MSDARRSGGLRIGLVNWSLGLGGAEQVIIHLARECARRGHQVTVFTLNEPGAFAERVTEVGIEVVPLYKRGRYDHAVLWRLAREFRARKIEVVHTHLWGGNLWGRLAARLAGVPVVVSTEQNIDPWKPWYYLVLDRWLASWATTLVAVSEEVRRWYEARGVGRGRWQVIYNSIPIPPPPSPARTRGPLHRELGLGEEPVVAWVGRFVPAKAPEVFIEAMVAACRRVPGLKAVMIGDGPLREQVRAAIAAKGLERHVVMTGLRQDVPELLVGMDVLVFSSTREGLSLAMLEAMALGVPVVATRVGGTPELIEDGVTGLLVEPEAPAALARRLVELLQDPARAAAIRQAARRVVEERFSAERMAQAYLDVYRAGPARPDGRIRVCYVIDDLGLGGAQRQLVELAAALPKDRYAVHVIALSMDKAEQAAPLRRSGVGVTLIDQQGAKLASVGRLVRTLRWWRPAIVHTWLFTADLYGRLAARAAGVPVVLSAVRSVDPDKPARQVRVDRVLQRLTDAFTVNVGAIGDVVARRERVPAGKIVTVYNGVDLRTYDPAVVDRAAARRALGLEAGAPVFGVIGRLVAVKDHATFLRAAAQVGARLPAARFLVVGSGPLQASLEASIRQLGIASVVRMLPARADVAGVFAALDVLVVSSVSEGCSNVILEAMAMGKPVIATAVGGNPELVEPEVTGLLVPAQDAARLAEAMQRLGSDRALAERFGAAGRRVAEQRFSLTRMVEQTDALYRRLLARRVPRGRCLLPGSDTPSAQGASVAGVSAPPIPEGKGAACG